MNQNLFTASILQRYHNKLGFECFMHTSTKQYIFADNVSEHFVNLSLELSKFSKTSDEFRESAYRYLNDIVIPHKVNVWNCGVMLMNSTIFKKYMVGHEHDFVNRLMIHDLSKFSLVEVTGYKDKHFGPGSVSSREFDLAWLNHKNKNDHHPEHWMNVNRQGISKPLEMRMSALFEMIADIQGAGLSYDESFADYMTKHKDTYVFHENTKKIFDEILTHFL